MTSHVRLDNVWQGVGVLTSTQVLAVEMHGAAESVLVLAWPKELSYLHLQASHGADQPRPFAREPEAVSRALSSAEGSSGVGAEFLERHHTLVALVRARDPVVLEIAVDTDDARFGRDAKQRADAERGLVLCLPVFHAAPGAPLQSAELRLVLSPAAPPLDYDGCVALDLGTSTCALVCLDLGRRQAEDIRVAGRDGRAAEAPPLPAAVRLTNVPGAAGSTAARRAHIGHELLSQTPVGLVLGLRHRAVAANALPTELFLWRVFQDFSAATRQRIPELALTCPAWYSPRETRRLRETVCRAWLRLRGENPTEERVAAADCVRLVLDETSAAAFYFLSRAALERAGGLLRLRYLYPGGQNLLLYDCGGTAIDVGLVTATVAPDDSHRLCLTTRGRGTLRDFGGDSITRAIFQLLKARIASAVLSASNKPAPPWPQSGSGMLAHFLASRENAVEQLVPTRFRPEVPDPANQLRRELTLALWNQAEQVKRWLTARGDADAPVVTFDKSFASALVHLLQRLGPGFRHEPLLEALNKVRLGRTEVDELVKEPLLRSVQLTNALIRRHLTEAGEEVHAVVVVGDGARYPLVTELLREHLSVLFLADRLVLDLENLKHAVAKGAVLALAAQRYAGGTAVAFDSDLARRLPFDLAYADRRSGTQRLLFRERELYEQLQPQTVPLPPGSGARHLVLSSRWPGEERFAPYVAFDFAEGTAGEVAVVRYDLEACEIVAEVGEQRGATRYLTVPDAAPPCWVDSGLL